ncbi:MAG: hypothetical protein ACRDMX_09100 [Solirubrobacteraceae bacterium]
MRSRAAAIAVALAAGVAAAPAGAATLLGGRAQARIAHAFTAARSHRGQTVVSIRASTVNPAWAVVRSVVAQRAGAAGSSSGTAPRLLATYYKLVSGSELQRSPPAPVRADLSRPFAVAVVYAGSGSESIAYDRSYGSACNGEGDFTDRQQVSVSPMAWHLVWTVELDDLRAAVRAGGQTTLAPAVYFDWAASYVDAVQSSARTLQDAGCSASPNTVSCRTTFRVGGSDPAGALSLSPAGLAVSVPFVATASGGDCASGDYPIGPSLWQVGAATVLAPNGDPLGGQLPAHPYAPFAVRWPGGSAQRSLRRFATGPCAGNGATCSDRFHWTATVTLQPASRG